MKRHPVAARAATLILVLASFVAPAAHGATVNVSTIFTNLGFESGNLSGWSLTQPNTDYVSSLSPAVNPSIDPADAGNNPAILTAPAGLYFTGLKRPGDIGVDLKYKLAHNAAPINVPTGTVFQVTVFANRGRLEPFDTPVSTADVLVRIFGWIAGTTPTVNSSDNWSRTVSWNPAAQSFDFTAVADGSWGQRTFTFDPAASSVDASTLKYLSVSIAGRTNNHDQYIALDLGDGLVPTQATTWSGVRQLYR